jgi:hypothetical protein
LDDKEPEDSSRKSELDNGDDEGSHDPEEETEDGETDDPEMFEATTEENSGKFRTGRQQKPAEPWMRPKITG